MKDTRMFALLAAVGGSVMVTQGLINHDSPVFIAATTSVVLALNAAAFVARRWYVSRQHGR